ncbi:MAG: hypothetical protein DCC88_11240 [Spirobacillus cienkowskii]|jgi:hypothetical protein|uniref:Uncharacterized protein n=1 Tax=Spirobacillus cienkowskii TaxID=495820 RepID=A0A369KVP2_9BACT|nr:MAG: hypothetical protein DCC88_11240 [Spirobacillus cienkowskii]
MPYYYKTQINKIKQLKTININKNNEEKYQNFAFVALFFKFVKEEYFFSSDFENFNSYLNKNDELFNTYLLNICALQKEILSNLLQNTSSYLKEYKELIKQTVTSPNTFVENAYLYSHKDFSFVRYLISDVENFKRNSGFIEDKQESTYCHFYFIQEVTGKRNSYGIFAFKKYDNRFFVLYDPHSGIKEYSFQEIAIFEDDFKNIIKTNNNSYCSFKIKFIANKKVFFNTKENFLKHLIYVSTKKYLNSIKDNIVKYNLGIGINNKEHHFVINYIKLYTKKTVTNDIEILNLFFENFYIFLENLVKENYTIQKTSFWLFFMLEYFYLNENYIYFKDSSKLCNSTIDSNIKENAHNLIYDKIKTSKHNEKQNIQLLFKFLVEHIYSEQFNYLPKNNFFPSIKLHNYFPIISKQEANKIGNAWLKTFECNSHSTCIDWNRQRVVFNGKLISKRCDHKADKYNASQQSPRHSPTLAVCREPSAPLETELKAHLFTVSECTEPDFANFCMFYCNQHSIFSIGHVLFNFLLHVQLPLSFSNRTAFINKVAKNCFEFNIITYFSRLEAYPDRPATIFKNPFEFAYGFLLVIENGQFKVSNFYIGMLNLKYLDNPEHKIITDFFRKILINQITIDFSEKNSQNQYINTKKTFLNYLQSHIKLQTKNYLAINV